MKILIGIVVFISICCLVLRVYGNIRDDRACKYCIVLGAGLYGDKLSSSLKRRLDAAILYADKYPCKIIVSGGQGKHETITEASAMQTYLLEKGIDKDRILLEDKSTSTYENFQFSKRLYLQEEKEIMITSCDFHMFRAKCMAKDAGLKGYKNPARSTKLKCIKYYYREVFCIFKYFITRD